MHIFIDESGNFLRPAVGGRNLSCVGALVVPEAGLGEVTGRFALLKQQWGVKGLEVKGSRLNEPQIAAVIELLIRYGCLFFVTATEMSVNDESYLKTFQQSEAEGLTATLTASAHPELIKQLTGLRATFERMPLQLFIQAVLLTDLVKKVIDVATLHFAMTSPADAGSFRWVLDRRNTTKTPHEVAWEMIAGPWAQSRNLASPGVMVEEGDYSHFQRFFSSNQRWPAHLPPPRSRDPAKPGKILDLGKILYESLTFADSGGSGGLQLADVITNAFRRAMMGRLRPESYYRLGELMIHLGKSPFELVLFAAGEAHPSLDEYTDPQTLIKSRSRFAGERA